MIVSLNALRLIYTSSVLVQDLHPHVIQKVLITWRVYFEVDLSVFIGDLEVVFSKEMVFSLFNGYKILLNLLLMEALLLNEEIIHTHDRNVSDFCRDPHVIAEGCHESRLHPNDRSHLFKSVW